MPGRRYDAGVCTGASSPPDTPPLVTVVTPSLNQGRFIRQTIESVLTQPYPALEYVVIDGGSTDGTLEILAGYGDRLTWVSEPDGGQAAAINKGWRRARGSVLAYLNSDDTYLPGAVARAVAALQAHPEAGAVYGDGYHTDERGTVTAPYPTEPFRLDRLAETCFICQPTVFIRRGVLEEVGLLDESLHYCLDWDLWIRIARRAPFVYVPGYLATTRLHTGAKTLRERAPVHAEGLTVLRRHFGRVTTRWTYAYAEARLLPGRRPGPLGRAWYVARLAALTVGTYVRYNRRLPRAAWRRWFGWTRMFLRQLGAHRAA